MMRRLGLIFCMAVWAFTANSALALTVTVGGTGVKDTAGDRKWLTYQQNVESRSNGDIEMRMLIYGELGPEENLVSGIRRGRIHVANWSGLATTTVVPEMAMLYTPFLFDDYAEADFIMDNYLFDAYSQLLADKDVLLLQWDEIGFNQIYTKQQVLDPANLQGVRFRTSSSESARLFAEVLGADAIPLGFTDIVTGLQTGLVDAGENAIIMYAPTGIASEASHLTLTNHSFATSIIVMRKRWVDRLPADQQEILKTSLVSISDSRQWTRDEWRTFLDEQDKWGFTSHDLTPDQRARWRDATAPVAKQMIDDIGGDAQRIWDLVQEGKAAFAAERTAAQ